MFSTSLQVYFNYPKYWDTLTLVLLNPDMPCLCKPSEEANWSESALFVIKYVNLYQQSGSSNLIGWKFEKGVASWFIQQDKG